MGAIDNTNLKTNLCGGCDCSSFVPAVSFAYDSNAKTITVTDSTTYGAGVNRKIVNFYIIDKNDKSVVGNIPHDDGDNAVTVNVASLDLSEGFVIKATVVADNGCISDGHFGKIGMIIAAGSLGSWDKDADRNVLVGEAYAGDDYES